MRLETKHIAFLVIPDATLLDITGPYEVFSQAIECAQVHNKDSKPPYELHTISVDRRNVVTASGLVIQCQETINSLDYKIDTLFIPGVPNSLLDQYKPKPKTLTWIREQSKAVRRTCSVCSGTFLLAESGILNDKKVTTHWEVCDILTHNYPDIHVDSTPIFIKDGNIYTSAGISSGMDLALALVEEDLGKPFALEVAKQMVLYLKRPGSQAQYSAVLSLQNVDYQPIRNIESWIQEHLHEIITVEMLAEHSSMSVRNFARVFVKETGITPAKYIDKLRVETACRYLADTNLSLKEIASLCGLGSPDNMRKVFIRYLYISPMDYRRNFGSAL